MPERKSEPKAETTTPETTPEIVAPTSPRAAEAAEVAAHAETLKDFEGPDEPRGKAGSAPDQASAFDQEVAMRRPVPVGDVPEYADNAIEAELRAMAHAGAPAPAIMQRREELLRKLGG